LLLVRQHHMITSHVISHSLHYLWHCKIWTAACSCGAAAQTTLRVPLFKAWRSHSGTSHSAWLLWMSDQHVAENSTDNARNRQTSMPSAGFEPSIPKIERPQTHALNLKATGFCEHLRLTSTVYRSEEWNFCINEAWTYCISQWRLNLLYIAVKSEVTVYHSEEWSYCISQWRVKLLYIAAKRGLTVYHNEKWTYCISQWRVNLLCITKKSELNCISQRRVKLLYIAAKRELTVYHSEDWTYCI
jgi:hypothetical protein